MVTPLACDLVLAPVVVFVPVVVEIFVDCLVADFRVVFPRAVFVALADVSMKRDKKKRYIVSKTNKKIGSQLNES